MVVWSFILCHEHLSQLVSIVSEMCETWSYQHLPATFQTVRRWACDTKDTFWVSLLKCESISNNPSSKRFQGTLPIPTLQACKWFEEQGNTLGRKIKVADYSKTWKLKEQSSQSGHTSTSDTYGHVSLCHAWRKQLFVGFSQKLGHLAWSGWVADDKKRGGMWHLLLISEKVCLHNVHVFVNVCSFKDIQTLH